MPRRWRRTRRRAWRGGATLVLADTRHPVFRPFATPAAALGDVMFERYWPVGDEGRRVLARFSGGPAALLEQPRPNGRLLIFASDLDNKWNRFPLSPAFVPFVVEAGRYLTEVRRQPQTWVLPAAPAGRRGAPGRPPAAGAGGAPDRRVAVNVNMEESNPAPISQDEFLAAVPRVPRTDPAGRGRRGAQGRGQTSGLWQWGLLVMFLALAGEGLVGPPRDVIGIGSGTGDRNEEAGTELGQELGEQRATQDRGDDGRASATSSGRFSRKSGAAGRAGFA